MTGCATTLEVKTDYDPSTNFSEMSKYLWYKRVDAPSQVVEARIRNAIDVTLYRKGIREARSGNAPDFRISFTAIGGPALTVDELFARLDYAEGAWSSPNSASTRVQKYHSGTLIIDVIDPVEGNLLWRGVASRPLDEKRKQSRKIDDVVKTVGAILEQFPPRPQTPE